MKEMLSVLRTSGIFSGISEEETEKMLHCLEVRPETFQKDEYILRAGDRVEAFGVVITGRFLGKPEYSCCSGSGTLFCRNLCLFSGCCIECKCHCRNQCAGTFFECKEDSYYLPVHLQSSQPDDPQSVI